MTAPAPVVDRPMVLLPAEVAIARSPGLPRWKRAMDIVGASLALVAFSPLILVISIATRLDSRGPVFFAQQRVGADGKPFTCWKFRSMCVDAESKLLELRDSNEATGPLFKMSDDPRRTRVGRILRKTSLDEVPQFWNVIRGEMTLVGPRPPLPSETALYLPSDWRRLRGVPGMTGPWQVYARHHRDFAEMVDYDVAYLQNIRFLTDVKLLLLTIPAVVAGHGAS